MKEILKATLYTDGGSRGNPGPAGIGYVLKITGRKVIEIGSSIGRATNNQAEYQALIAGIRRAKKEKVSKLNVFMDSELIVKQMKYEYRVKDAGLKPLFAQAQKLAAGFAQISFKHVRREKNKRADRLANQALDRVL